MTFLLVPPFTTTCTSEKHNSFIYFRYSKMTYNFSEAPASLSALCGHLVHSPNQDSLLWDVSLMFHVLHLNRENCPSAFLIRFGNT